MIACNTRISSIIDDHLSYSGYDISEFMENKASFEEVIYLLWNGHLPTQMELKYFEAEFVRTMIFLMLLSNAFLSNLVPICTQ